MYNRKIIAVILSVFFISFSSHTFAEDQAVTTNEQNEQSITTDSTSELSVTDDALTQNAISLGADTGSNNVENGTIIDNFQSGDISGQITSANNSNSSLAPDSSIQIKTSDTDVEVNADDFNNMDSVFIIGSPESNTSDPENQLLYVNNDEQVNLDFNTGENNFEHNTLINNTETGNIDFATNLINISNLDNPTLLATIKMYSILDDFIGDVVVEDSFLDEPPAVEIFNSHQSTALSSVTSETSNSQFDMNTGENSFADNSLVGSIDTGDSAAGYFQNEFSGLLNKANFFILNVLGEWTGTNFLAGYDNVIVNTLDSQSNNPEVSIYDDSSNSSSIIDQDTTYNVKANTGRNSFRENTYVGNLQTGHINLLEYVLALKPNLQSMKNKLNIRVLNILGSWKGNLTKSAKALDETPIPTPTTTPATEPEVQPEAIENTSTETSVGQVLGVQETAQANEVLATSSQKDPINPGNIEAGTNISNLLYLLLIFPAIAIARRVQKF